MNTEHPRSADDMTILDCINEMHERSHAVDARFWRAASDSARSWGDHAGTVKRARVALAHIRSNQGAFKS